MSTFAEAFDVPVKFERYGLSLSLPKLDIDDHVAWCAELHEQRKPKKLKLIPGNTQPLERFKMQRNVEFDEPTIDDIADLIYTAAGARTCLDKSLAKAGMAENDRRATLKKIPPGAIQRLALDVSGLFEKVPPQLPAQGGASPLAEGGQSPGIPTSVPEATGDGQDSSSANTPTENQSAG
jgi:hypothetical protein